MAFINDVCGGYQIMVKFLIIRFSSIGDIVLTTPVIRCLKQQVIGAEVHFVTKKQFSPVISNNPYIDKRFTFDGDLKLLVRQLKRENYDYIIDLHNNLRTLYIKHKLNAQSFSFNKLNFKKWLVTNFKINKLPPVHIVERYLDTTKHFNVQNDSRGLDFFISPENEVSLASLPENYRNAYVALVIGAKHATKQLPALKLIELCNKLNKPVIILGGKDEKQKADDIINKCNIDIYNACGLYNIQQSASILQQAKVVITHDTGLMHIAAAFKKDIISIWGNTIPELGMYPYLVGREHYIFEVKNLNCRPCHKLGYAQCPKKHFNCMNQINIDEIVKKTVLLFNN
jgi:heptosyltransferase-2